MAIIFTRDRADAAAADAKTELPSRQYEHYHDITFQPYTTRLLMLFSAIFTIMPIFSRHAD